MEALQIFCFRIKEFIAASPRQGYLSCPHFYLATRPCYTTDFYIELPRDNMVWPSEMGMRHCDLLVPVQDWDSGLLGFGLSLVTIWLSSQVTKPSFPSLSLSIKWGYWYLLHSGVGKFVKGSEILKWKVQSIFTEPNCCIPGVGFFAIHCVGFVRQHLEARSDLFKYSHR